MRQDWLAAFAFISVIALATASASAQMNGPMSSGQKAAAPAQAAPEKPAAVDAKGQMDVRKLFAGTCGWCHSDGGRAPGKGPQLMGTTQTDAEIANRIRNGKTGAMPAFGSAFSADEIQAIIHYIRELKPDGPPS